MRNSVILFCPALLLACAAAPAPYPGAGGDQNDTTIENPSGAARLAPGTFVFYNVENLFDTNNDEGSGDDDFTPEGKLKWTNDRYTNKLNRLAEALTLTGKELPYLIGLSEVENARVVKDLSHEDALAQAQYRVVHFDSPDERGIDVALLVAKDLGEIVTQEAIAVNLEGGDATRDILHVEIEVRSGERLHVFVNHWPSRREGEVESAPKRMIAAKTLRTSVDRILATDAKARILIMGDLNDTPANASLIEGLGTSVDPKDTKAHFVDLVAADHGKYPGSVARDGVWSYFDHMIVSQGLLHSKDHGLRAVSAASLKEERLIFHHEKYGDQPNRTFSGRDSYHANGYSDHLPVVLLVE